MKLICNLGIRGCLQALKHCLSPSVNQTLYIHPWHTAVITDQEDSSTGLLSSAQEEPAHLQQRGPG